jgi:hypothetical protein
VTDDNEFSVESARDAAARDELRDWVVRFLASPGSDNAPLGAKLGTELRWWTGPIEVPIDRLFRLAGPAGDPVVCAVDDDYWDERVERMETRVEAGDALAPVVVALRDGQLVLEDGNHRVEGARQADRLKV